MKTILMTAYAINPYKGSEDGMGWNFVLQAAAHNNVIAITRKNNRPFIEKYMAQHPNAAYTRIQFEYFDWPKALLFWKKGPILSLIYYYFWQLSLALHLKKQTWEYDIVHNLNFHNDWTPSFLWLTRKPLVWGPVGHHPKIKKEQLDFYGFKAYLSDRFLWTLKNIFWHLDPFLWITKKKAKQVLCMNSEAVKVLNLKNGEYTICPSVATEDAAMPTVTKNGFTVISAGRFVPLKGFDLTISAFSAFYHQLSIQEKKTTRLHLVGSGPYQTQLKKRCADLGVQEVVQFTSWIERESLQKLYASSSVFLFPSYEGAGMVVAEAMAHSLPVVCWNNSGPGEFVSPLSQLKIATNANPQEAVEQFASNLMLLYLNPEIYRRESMLARARFLSHFTWDTRGELLAKCYDEIALKKTTKPQQPQFKELAI